ncbi:class I adenylate-forming enzyme family protein [Phenylobacterium soli]|uniref:Long-chain fatty acid--CoA ligase n=1 Tax=Phenylobacterium soli TaxID=2170551 RepID=A0A328AMI1_9CAUL|nr:class I adenylate-forming enzyme family protein [Phenylobacterium soli]RAK55747.1 long-chain fatty acid--CoA ligase [Phenylobacterium soli]
MPSRQDVIAAMTASGPFELAHDHSAGYPARVYRNAPASMRELLLATRAHGDKPFLIYEDRSLTYAEHFGRVAALAAYLKGLGVAKGDRVAIGMRNYPEWSLAFWACQAIGAIAVALNAWWTTAELAYALEDAEPKAVVVDRERLDRMRPLIGGFDPAAVIVARRGEHGLGGVDLEAVAGEAAEDLPEAEVGPEDLATILYTSGTTGFPKGAMATHRNHVTNTMNSLLSGAAARVAAGAPEPGPDTPQPGVLQTFPFFHIGGLTGLYVSAVAGSKMALMYKWAPAEAVKIVETHRLSGVSGVPIVVRQFLEAAAASGADVSSIAGVTSGGAPVPPDLIRRIESQFAAKAAPGNGYGLTETTSAVIVNGGADYFAQPDSVGRPAPTAEICVVDDEGRPVPDGQVGEIWVRGPNVIPGYWKKPEATEAAFGGGWFRTGDLGYVDAQGLYYVVDRKKDVIIRGGENVYCAEVEAAILEQPGVLDAAVVGLPHPDYGEEVAAVIQVAPQDLSGPIADQVRAALAERLAKFKIPTAIRLTADPLPRTATGKVLKRELKEVFA